MVDENNPEREQPDESDSGAGAPPTPADAAPAETVPSDAGAVSQGKPKALTPGQRLAAKKAQKAIDKREAKDERKRAEEEERIKEQEEADRLLGRAPVEPALPAEVERAATGFSNFLHDNRGLIVGGIVGAIALAGVAVGVRHFMHAAGSEQATQLTQALAVANAAIDPEDADGKTDDGEPVFKSEQDRAAKAVDAFDGVAKGGIDQPAARWAMLASGAALVQLGKFEDAQKRFQALVDAKEPALAARALEGDGIALEAAGKLDEAAKKYEALSKLDGNKDLGEYHLARLQLQKGDVEGGKTLLKALYDRLSTPAEGSAPSHYLRSEVEVRLAEIDSSLVDKGSSGDAPQQFSEEQIQRMIEQLQRQQQGQ